MRRALGSSTTPPDQDYRAGDLVSVDGLLDNCIDLRERDRLSLFRPFARLSATKSDGAHECHKAFQRPSAQRAWKSDCQNEVSTTLNKLFPVLNKLLSTLGFAV
jgi:hypothetical protein